MTQRTTRILAVMLGATAVMAGAFGAHGLKDMVTPERLEVWKTGAHYQLIHAVVLLVLSLLPSPPRLAVLLITTGIGIFSGSLYLLVLLDQKMLGMVTPFGGVSMILGWLLLLRALPKDNQPVL